MENVKYMTLNDEEMSALQKYEKLMMTALQYGTLRGASAAISKAISSIVDKDKKRLYNWGCGGCVIGLYKRAARIYKYNIEQRASKVETQEASSDDSPKDTDVQVNKNTSENDGKAKRTRKKDAAKENSEIQGEA